MINPSINPSINHTITHIIINTTYINSTHFNHTTTRLLQRVTDQRSSLGFSLSLNDRRLRLTCPLQPHNLLLLRTRHHELGLLRALQCHLLLLNGVVEVASERQMRDRHIVQLDVVLLRTLLQQLANTLRHLLSLRQQLLRIVLSDHSLHDLVAQRGKHTVTVVGTHLTVDRRQKVQIGMCQNSKGNADGLQVLRSGLRGNLTRRSADVVNVGVLEITLPDPFPPG